MLKERLKNIRNEESLIDFINTFRNSGALIYIKNEDEHRNPLNLKILGDKANSGIWQNHLRGQELEWMMIYFKRKGSSTVWLGLYSGEPIELGDRHYSFELSNLTSPIETSLTVKELSGVEAPQKSPRTLKLPKDADLDLVNDLKNECNTTKIQKTEQSQMILARLGQGRFREEVLAKWSGGCAVTGAKILDAIRASHIKPWKDCDSKSRLSAENGIPLVATLDALFDKGLITFEDDGAMLVSKKISKSDCKLFDIPKNLSKAPSEKMKNYLRYHRLKVFKGKK
jgi:hypothetical protein